MNLFADYIHPLTGWLQAHPSWALFITFFIAMAESLAIIGSIVPGSVTMTAIGILAGSGVMRIDLTLIASTLGAVCGDSLSYALGYFYSDKLLYIWPFKKYPQWLHYGKDFFSRHGGKSVLIGRFVGPLRSIIPVIAGIMHMKQWRFLIANIISAIGWSFLYVMPGVLIGAAGHELSAESATRLFIIILILLFAIWLLSLLIKWTLIKLHSFFKNNLHGFWSRFQQRPYLNKLYTLFTPENEVNHYPTAGLILLTLFSIITSIILLALNIQAEYIKSINVPVHLFLQSLHTYLLETFFIFCTQLTSTLTIAFLYVVCCMWFLYNKKIRALISLSTLISISCLVSYLLSHLVSSPRPQGLLITMLGNSFPNENLLVATALYGFIFYYINNKYLLVTNILRSFILIVLGLSGIGSIYLGDYWLTDVLGAYFTGAAICLIICLFHRKHHLYHGKKPQSTAILVLLVGAIFGSTIVSTVINFKTLEYAHTPYRKEYTLHNLEWWSQPKPLLPLYRLNRVGKRTSLFNIQYSGDLTELQNKLAAQGWEAHNESFFKKLLMHLNENENELKLPLFTQLYENKRPELIMVYKDLKNDVVIQLMMWKSNYNLNSAEHPLWIGTLYPTQQNINSTDILKYIIPLLNEYTLKRVPLPAELLKDTLFPYEPYILLIKK